MCHLMIAPVDPFVADFAAAGADIITFHPEAGAHPHRTVQLIKSLGKRPASRSIGGYLVDVLDYLLPDLDLGAGDERQSGFRRPGLHPLGACENRRNPPPHRQGECGAVKAAG